MDATTEQQYNYYGFPQVDGLDILFTTPNRKNDYRFSFISRSKGNEEDDPVSFSNNITILGMPGTGKSTLALSMAAGLRCEMEAERKKDEKIKIDKLKTPNNTCSILYFSLEQSITSIRDRLEEIKPKAFPIGHLNIDRDKLPQNIIDQILKNIKKEIDKGYRVNEKTLSTISRLKTYCEKNNLDTLLKTYCEKYKLNSLLTKVDHEIDSQNYIIFPQLSPLPLLSSCDTSDVRGQGVFWKRFEELKQRIEMVKELGTDKGEDSLIPPLRMVIIDSLSMFADVPLTRYMVDQLFAFFAEKEVMGVLILESNSENPKVISESNANVTAAADVVIKLTWNEKGSYSFRQINVTKSRHSPNNCGNHIMKMVDAGCRIFPSLHAWHPLLGNFTDDNPNAPGGCQNILIYGEKHTRKTEFAMHCLDPDESLKPFLPKGNTDNDLPLQKPFLLISFGETSNSGDITWVKFDAPFLPSKKGVIYESFDNEHKDDGWLMKIHSGALLPEELIWYIDRACVELKKTSGNINTIIFKNISSWEYSYPLLYENVASQHDTFFPILRRYCAYRKLACICTCSEENPQHPLLRTLKAMAQLSVHIKRNRENFDVTFDNKDKYKRFCMSFQPGKPPKWEFSDASL